MNDHINVKWICTLEGGLIIITENDVFCASVFLFTITMSKSKE